MSGRGALATASSGNALGSGGTGDHHSNQPMDLAQKTTQRPMEGGGIVKSGGTTLVHYTTGVAQILTSGAPAHVVTAKPVVRSEMGVGGQTVTLVSRTSSNPGALNLATPGPGSGSNPSVRTVSHSSGSATSSASVSSASQAQLAYHIPRGAAAVANMAAPRSQVVATPIMRATGQPAGQAGSNVQGQTPFRRGNVVGQRVTPVSSSGGWVRGSPSPAHTGKVTVPSMHPGVTATSLSLGVPRGTVPVQRAGQPGGAITTYHAGVRPGGGSIRGQGPPTMRGMVSGDTTRGSNTKAVHITQPIGQPQKYGGSLMGSGARGGVTSGPGQAAGPGATVGSTGTLYTPGSSLVTTTMAGPAGVNAQGTIRAQAPPTIAVRITTAPVPTDTSSSQVTSQAVTSIGALAMTSSSGTTTGTILTNHPSMQRGGPHEHGVPIKTPIVRTPMSSHHNVKSGAQTQTLAFSDGPKVITQPAQGPPLALAQITGLAGVTTHKTQVSTHTVQQQHPHASNVQHRPGGNVVGTSVGGRVLGGANIPVAKVLPQQASTQNQGSVSVATTPRGIAHSQVRAQSPGQATEPQPAHTSVFLQRAHPGVTGASGPVTQGERVATTMSQYSIAPPFYYEQGQNTYQYVAANVQGGPQLRVAASSASNQAVGGGIGGTVPGGDGSASQGSISAPSSKPNASPRPSILRKRPDNDGTPLKAVKNLASALSLPMPSPPSPKRPDSRGNGNASSGSTTISANSSPGLQIEEMDGNNSNPPTSTSGLHGPPNLKQEPPEDATLVLPRPTGNMGSEGSGSLPTTLNVPQPHLSSSLSSSQVLPDGLSPRKKPRKQQLMGNELQEARSSEDDLDHHHLHHPLKKIKRDITDDHHDMEVSEDDGEGWSEPGGGGGSSGGSCGNGNSAVGATVVITNRPSMSLLNSFRQTWKPRHNHFVRHTDVKPKDERRQTVNEIANQKMAMQRVNGWKVVHLSGQVDDLVDMEGEVVDRFHMLLTSLEKRTNPRKPYKDFDKDVNRLSELVKANIQRSKIIKDQMTEAKSQMHKLFDHKAKIVDIMTKYSCKRSVRKKEKS